MNIFYIIIDKNSTLFKKYLTNMMTIYNLFDLNYVFNAENCDSGLRKYMKNPCVRHRGISHAYISRLLRLLSDIRQDSAVHIKNVAVYRVRGVTCQKYRRARKLLGLEPSSGRRLCTDKRVKWVS